MEKIKAANAEKEEQREPKIYPPTRYSDTLYGCGYCRLELPPGKPDYCERCGRKVKWD